MPDIQLEERDGQDMADGLKCGTVFEAFLARAEPRVWGRGGFYSAVGTNSISGSSGSNPFEYFFCVLPRCPPARGRAGSGERHMRRVLFVLLAALAWVLAGFLVSDVAQRWISLEDPHGRVNAALILPVALLILAGAISLSAWVWRNWDLLGGEPPQKDGEDFLGR
jgi:hypothetical protein